jgi:Spy/CpxP family protein refolding chaperone
MEKNSFAHAVLVLILGLSLCLPGFAHAFPEGKQGSPPWAGHRLFLKLIKDLDLTDDQKAALEELKAETRTQIEPRVEEIRELGVDEVLLAEEIDPDDASAKLAEMGNLKCKIAAIRASQKLEAARILTPEQRQIVLERIQTAKSRRLPGEGRKGRR